MAVLENFSLMNLITVSRATPYRNEFLKNYFSNLSKMTKMVKDFQKEYFSCNTILVFLVYTLLITL